MLLSSTPRRRWWAITRVVHKTLMYIYIGFTIILLHKPNPIFLRACSISSNFIFFSSFFTNTAGVIFNLWWSVFLKRNPLNWWYRTWWRRLNVTSKQEFGQSNLNILISIDIRCLFLFIFYESLPMIARSILTNYTLNTFKRAYEISNDWQFLLPKSLRKARDRS